MLFGVFGVDASFFLEARNTPLEDAQYIFDLVVLALVFGLHDVERVKGFW